MGLKARQIKTMIEEFADHSATQFNKKMATKFEFAINWSVLPEDIDGWNWDDESLKACFLNSFFHPLELTFTELFKDKMYHKAITEQVLKVKFEPGRSGCIDCEYEGSALVIKHTLGANQRELSGNVFFNKSAVNAITEVINKKLQ